MDIPAVNDLCLAEFVAYYYKEYWKENSETIDVQPQVLIDSAIEAQHLDNDSLSYAILAHEHQWKNEAKKN